MNDLLWWHGIGWNTPLNQIGWYYVAVGALVVLAIHLIRKAWKDPEEK